MRVAKSLQRTFSTTAYTKRELSRQGDKNHNSNNDKSNTAIRIEGRVSRQGRQVRVRDNEEEKGRLYCWKKR